VFCSQVSVVLPDTINVSEVITDLLNEDCDYYEVEDIHVSHLISKEFIEAFVKKGTTQLVFLLGEVMGDDKCKPTFLIYIGFVCIFTYISVWSVRNVKICSHRILVRNLWVNCKLEIQYWYLVDSLFLFLNC
jgi:hypothetical protein